MALIVEAVGRTGVVERIAVEGGKAVINAQPGITYRILDEAGRPVNATVTVERLGDHLVVKGLPEEATVQLTDFFFVCTPNDPCSLDLEGLGGAKGETINQLSEPVAALADGSFVLHAPASMATPTAPESEFSAKPALAGLALLAVAGGGGGGGSGGGSSGPPPGTPVVTSAPLTNDPTPTITGTATPGASITLTLNVPGSGPITLVTTADEAGNWTIDTGAVPSTMPPDGLPEGEITGLLIAQNAGGSSPDPIQFQIRIDTTPPVAVAELTAVTDDAEGITGALADGALTNDATPTLSGTLSQALEVGDVVRVLRDGVPVGTALVSGTQWVYEDSGLSDGASHVYSVRVEDAAGNASTATPDFTISTDFTPPGQPTINTIAGDNFVNEAEGRVSNPSPITVSGSADPGTLVRITWGVEVEDVVAAADGSWSFDFDGQQIPDGMYTVTATAHDAAGNASEPAGLGVQVLTGKPSAPSFNAVEGDDLVNAEEAANGVTLTGGTTPGTSVEVTVNGVAYSATVAGGTWSLTLPAGTLPDGIYTASAVATDSAGNVSVAGATDNPFIIDSVPPAQTVAITDALDDVALHTDNIPNGGLTNDQTPTIQGTLSAGLAAGEVVHVYRAGVLLGEATVSGTSWSYADNLTADGTHSYTAQVVDAAGNLGPMSAEFSLILDTAPPTTTAAITQINDNAGTVTGPVASGGITDDTTPQLQGTLSTALGAGETLQILRDDAVIGTATVDGTGWTYNDSLSGDNTYSYTARVVDGAGNIGPASTTFSLILDTAAPTQTVTITQVNDDAGAVTGPVASGGATDDTTPQLQGTLSPTGLAPGETLQILRDGAVIGTATVDGANWTFDDSLPADDTYSYTARVIDGAGNIGPASTTFSLILDTAAPTQTVTITQVNDDAGAVTGPVASGGATDDTTPQLQGTLSPTGLAPGETLQILRDGAVIGTATVDGTGWTYNDTLTTDGTYAYTARAIDSVGNLGSPSAEFSLILDSRILTIESILDNDTADGPIQLLTISGATANDATPTLTINLDGVLASPVEQIHIYRDGVDLGAVGPANELTDSLPPASPGSTTPYTYTAHVYSGGVSIIESADFVYNFQPFNNPG